MCTHNVNNQVLETNKQKTNGACRDRSACFRGNSSSNYNLIVTVVFSVATVLVLCLQAGGLRSESVKGFGFNPKQNHFSHEP